MIYPIEYIFLIDVIKLNNTFFSSLMEVVLQTAKYTMFLQRKVLIANFFANLRGLTLIFSST